MARASSAAPGGPLQGLSFLNTREAARALALTERLEAQGARVIEAPTQVFAPPLDWGPFDARLRRLGAGDWLVFTSATAVQFTLERMRALGEAPARLQRTRIASIGKATAQALEAAGLPVALVPLRFQQEALLEALLAVLTLGDAVWIPRAQEAREVLAEGLVAAGIPVTVTPVYRTLAPEGGLGPAEAELRAGRVDWILFTSSSTVDNFIALLGEELRQALSTRWPRVACLGEVTAETARRHGLPVAVVPERQDLAGLVAAVVACVQGEGP
jgi:uroporphyrinogen-III synthase